MESRTLDHHQINSWEYLPSLNLRFSRFSLLSNWDTLGCCLILKNIKLVSGNPKPPDTWYQLVNGHPKLPDLGSTSVIH